MEVFKSALAAAVLGAATLAAAGAAVPRPVPEECRSALWAVRADGAACDVAAARTCDEPFKGWGFRQGGEYAFVSFETTEPTALRVRSLVPRDLSRVRIMPEGVPAKIHAVEDGEIEMTVFAPCRFSLEPDGRESPLLVFAERPSGSAPDPADPQVLFFGPGVHDAGRIELGDGETLYLAAGAFVRCGVLAHGRDVKIRGPGVLDSSLYPWRKGPVPHVIQLASCTNAVVEGITVLGPCHWTIVPVGCDGVTVRDVKICGGRVRNDDGLDPCNSRDVLVERCFFRTDDDCVAVKGTAWGEKHGGIENVVVRDCTFWSDNARIILLGHESRAPFLRGVRIENCDTVRSRLPALLVEPGEGMPVEDVFVKGFRVRDDLGDPGFAALKVRPCVNEYMKTKEPGSVARLLLEDVRVRCVSSGSVFRIEGADERHRVRDVSLSGVFVGGVPLAKGDVAVGPFVDGVAVNPRFRQ